MDKGPYLISAMLCDQVIEGKDGALSAIRIVDKIILAEVGPGLQAPAGLPAGARIGPHQIQFTLLVVLKSGDFRGRGKVGVVPVAPSGKALGRRDVEVELHGGGHGVNVIVRGAFPPTEYGLYWFDVYFNDRPLTRSPLEVEFVESGQQQTTGDQSPETQRTTKQ